MVGKDKTNFNMNYEATHFHWNSQTELQTLNYEVSTFANSHPFRQVNNLRNNNLRYKCL